MIKLPVVFISHGGGPWPWMPEMKGAYRITVDALKSLGDKYRPRAILMISAHWEESEFTISSSAQPPMIYDYGGFPPHTYEIHYKAKGSPELALSIQKKLTESGLRVNVDPERGFDHGTFVPLYCMYPEATIPVVQLSIKESYSPSEHFRLGESLEYLRDEGVMIVGSGLTYHNLRKFFNGSGVESSKAFERWITTTIETNPRELLNWKEAPSALEAHPREDHLVPLFVTAGAGKTSEGERLFLDKVYGIEMASYIWH